MAQPTSHALDAGPAHKGIVPCISQPTNTLRQRGDNPSSSPRLAEPLPLTIRGKQNLTLDSEDSF
eukprot:6865804-Pyramimonas_sp.AAC.1